MHLVHHAAEAAVVSPRACLGAVVAVVAALAVAGVGLLAGGAGAGGQSEGALAWEGETTVFTPEGLPTDRILTGEIRNVSPRDVALDVVDVRIADGAGEELESTARFASAFGHGLMSPAREGDPGAGERERLGQTVMLRPGQSAPVTLSWRLPDDERGAQRVELGASGLTLPRR